MNPLSDVYQLMCQLKYYHTAKFRYPSLHVVPLQVTHVKFSSFAVLPLPLPSLTDKRGAYDRNKPLHIILVSEHDES
jgi:hypothetical protein